MPRFCSIKKTRFAGLPVSEWPEADRALFQVESRVDDPFAPTPPMAAFSESFRQSIARVNAIWLAFLHHAYPQCLDRQSFERLTPDAVAAFDRTLAADGLADFTRLFYLERLFALATATAPKTDWGWFNAAIRKLRHQAKPVRPKPVVEIVRIFELGISLMNEVLAGSSLTEIRAARRYRDGLILALWAARPLRLKNFAGLDIDRHLFINGDAVTIRIPAEEVKNGLTDERLVPEVLCPYLQRYLSEFRPRIPGAQSHRKLWASAQPRSMTPVAVANILKRLTRDRLGIAIRAHGVRHSAGTSIAVSTPIEAKIAMAVLGHSQLATGSKYYNMATSVDAQRKATANLRSLHKRLRAQKRRRARHDKS